MADDTNTAERAGAYDMIDRFLRNNLSSDEDYAEYSKALDLVLGASLAASAGSEPVAPAAPPMDGEIALIEKAVKRVGIKSLLNYGAGSLVYSEGVEGVTQDDLLAYTREIALHCAVALGSPPEGMAAEQALRKVLAAVQRYMPPDGPSAQDTMSEIIAIVDPWPLGQLEKS